MLPSLILEPRSSFGLQAVLLVINRRVVRRTLSSSPRELPVVLPKRPRGFSRFLPRSRSSRQLGDPSKWSQPRSRRCFLPKRTVMRQLSLRRRFPKEPVFPMV
ncbi:unnamed protein product, partial [Brassica oleracea var. botrytis]